MQEIVEVFGIDWKLLLIQAVNFGLLLAILWRFLYRPLNRIVTERQQVIEKGVKDAEKAEEKLASIEDEKDSIIVAATKDGEKIVSNAVIQAKDRESKLVAEAHAKSEAIMKDAELKSQELKKKAMSESDAEIAKVAILAAEKVIRQKV